jgi:hypothetical protein
MRGRPNWNLEVFREGAKVLEARGWQVTWPSYGLAEIDSTQAWTPELHHEAMRRNIRAILEADTLFVLPGWERSRGTKCEIEVARQIGIPVVQLDALWDETEIAEYQVTLAKQYTAGPDSKYLGPEDGS